MTASFSILQQQTAGAERTPWSKLDTSPLVGKDVLELLSSAMYVNPLSIYREYVQNAADAIDEARGQGIMTGPGRVDVTIDAGSRSVVIRDNGIGISDGEFSQRLTAFGASRKRGARLRGFRGVGRLAGLGYCQELFFRSRQAGAQRVNELRWDCRQLRTFLGETQKTTDLGDLVRGAVTTRQTAAAGSPDHFFEVELRGIVRHGSDVLMSPATVERYLSEISPVPFSPEFEFGNVIERRLTPHVALGNVHLVINSQAVPVFRPHRSTFEVRNRVRDRFNDIEFYEFEGSNGTLAAVGWLLQHSYLGALPLSAGMKGLRVRVGNMQIGDDNLLDHLFPEPRFNSWVVGEIHVLDDTVVPNGRRDHFEPNAPFLTLINRVSPLARELAHRCRSSSTRRNWLRRFEQSVSRITEHLATLRQGALSQSRRTAIIEDLRRRMRELDGISKLPVLGEASQMRCQRTSRRIAGRISRILARDRIIHRKLATLKTPERNLLTRVFDVIHRCSSSDQTGRALIDRILREI